MILSRYRPFLLALAAIFSMLAAFSVRADAPVVVELFTSQGCSSCPPADALLAEIADRDDVIALALHVDYWDYIGWKDKFADPAFTKRQKLYAYASKSRTIYTPQMIVGGRDHVVGYKPMELAKQIEQHKRKPGLAKVNLNRSGNRLSVEIPPARVGSSVVRLAIVNSGETVKIKRGENAGHTFTYRNIVQDLIDLADWDGRTAFSRQVDVPPGSIAVVFVQSEGMGPILGAARAD